jgi:hypothetical protein
LGLGRQFGQIDLRAFWVFTADLSAPILVLWVLFPCFPWINHYFYKKLSLYIQIPNINFGLGFEFEFWLQRIGDLAIMCLSVVFAIKDCMYMSINLSMLFYFKVHHYFHDFFFICSRILGVSQLSFPKIIAMWVQKSIVQAQFWAENMFLLLRIAFLAFTVKKVWSS